METRRSRSGVRYQRPRQVSNAAGLDRASGRAIARMTLRRHRVPLWPACYRNGGGTWLEALLKRLRGRSGEHSSEGSRERESTRVTPRMYGTTAPESPPNCSTSVQLSAPQMAMVRMSLSSCRRPRADRGSGRSPKWVRIESAIHSSPWQKSFGPSAAISRQLFVHETQRIFWIRLRYSSLDLTRNVAPPPSKHFHHGLLAFWSEINRSPGMACSPRPV